MIGRARPRRWTAFAALLLGGASSFAATNALPAVTLSSTAVAFSLVRLIGALALVIALFFAGVWLFRNWQRLVVHRGKTPKLNVVEVRSLGQRHALYVVAYEDQRLLLASSPAGITMLTRLDAADSEATDPAQLAPTNFAEVLSHASSRSV